MTQQQTMPPTQVVKTTKTVVPPPIKTEPPQEVYESKKAIFRTYQIVWYILGVIEVLMIFRILLKAFGANPLNGFTYVVYGASSLFSAPFLGMFQNITQDQNVFEVGTFIGCFVYLVVAYGIIQLLQLIKPTNPKEVEENV